jgi:hypothetical protein
MKKKLCLIVLVCFSQIAIAQRFSQYNTGTLYESFENPSVGIYKPDTSRQFAFNFLIPNSGTYTYLKGNAQYSLKSRLFLDRYDSENLEIGQGKVNNFMTTSNTYLLMFKAFTSLNGEQQIGFSAQTRVDAGGTVTDETIALLQGTERFTANSYNDILNNRASFSAYHQISGTYREKVNKSLSLGFKISGLLGIAYNKLSIDNSDIAFNNANNTSALALNGSYKSSFEPGKFKGRDIKPSFKNPGLSVSMGFSYKTNDNILIQGNIKDLGFIRWGGDARSYNFSGNAQINYSSGSVEQNTSDALSNIVDKIRRLSHL